MVRFAAFLLRRIGGSVEYRVQRLRSNKGRVVSSKDGTTLLRTNSFKEAKAKLRKVRVGDDQTVCIRLVAKVAIRMGGVTIIGNSMDVDHVVGKANTAQAKSDRDGLPGQFEECIHNVPFDDCKICNPQENDNA